MVEFAAAMKNFAAIEARLASASAAPDLTDEAPPPLPDFPLGEAPPPPPDAPYEAAPPPPAASFTAAMSNFAAIEARLAGRSDALPLPPRPLADADVAVNRTALGDAPPPPSPTTTTRDALDETVRSIEAARSRRETDLLRIVQDFRRLTGGTGTIDVAALRTLLPAAVPDGGVVALFAEFANGRTRTLGLKQCIALFKRVWSTEDERAVLSAVLARLDVGDSAATVRSTLRELPAWARDASERALSGEREEAARDAVRCALRRWEHGACAPPAPSADASAVPLPLSSPPPPSPPHSPSPRAPSATGVEAGSATGRAKCFDRRGTMGPLPTPAPQAPPRADRSPLEHKRSADAELAAAEADYLAHLAARSAPPAPTSKLEEQESASAAPGAAAPASGRGVKRISSTAHTTAIPAAELEELRRHRTAHARDRRPALVHAESGAATLEGGVRSARASAPGAVPGDHDTVTPLRKAARRGDAAGKAVLHAAPNAVAEQASARGDARTTWDGADASASAGAGPGLERTASRGRVQSGRAEARSFLSELEARVHRDSKPSNILSAMTGGYLGEGKHRKKAARKVKKLLRGKGARAAVGPAPLADGAEDGGDGADAVGAGGAPDGVAAAVAAAALQAQRALQAQQRADELAVLRKDFSAVSSELGSLRMDFRREVAATVEQTSSVFQSAVAKMAASQQEARQMERTLHDVESKIDALVTRALARATPLRGGGALAEGGGAEGGASAFEAMIAATPAGEGGGAARATPASSAAAVNRLSSALETIVVELDAVRIRAAALETENAAQSEATARLVAEHAVKHAAAREANAELEREAAAAHDAAAAAAAAAAAMAAATANEGVGSAAGAALRERDVAALELEHATLADALRAKDDESAATAALIATLRADAAAAKLVEATTTEQLSASLRAARAELEREAAALTATSAAQREAADAHAVEMAALESSVERRLLDAASAATAREVKETAKSRARFEEEAMRSRTLAQTRDSLALELSARDTHIATLVSELGAMEAQRTARALPPSSPLPTDALGSAAAAAAAAAAPAAAAPVLAGSDDGIVLSSVNEYVLDRARGSGVPGAVLAATLSASASSRSRRRARSPVRRDASASAPRGPPTSPPPGLAPGLSDLGANREGVSATAFTLASTWSSPLGADPGSRSAARSHPRHASRSPPCELRKKGSPHQLFPLRSGRMLRSPTISVDYRELLRD